MRKLSYFIWAIFQYSVLLWYFYFSRLEKFPNNNKVTANWKLARLHTYSDGFVYICIVKVGIDEEPCNGSMCNSEVISPSFFGRPFSAGALQQSRSDITNYKVLAEVPGVSREKNLI